MVRLVTDDFDYGALLERLIASIDQCRRFVDSSVSEIEDFVSLVQNCLLVEEHRTDGKDRRSVFSVDEFNVRHSEQVRPVDRRAFI